MIAHTPFCITEIESADAYISATKHLCLNSGQVAKKPYVGISKGTGRIRHFHNLSQFSEYLAELIDSGNRERVFLSGLPSSATSLEDRFKIRSKSKSTPDSVSLSANDFEFTQYPTIALIDYDPPALDSHATFHGQILRHGLISTLDRIAPELRLSETAHIIKGSTSAGIKLHHHDGSVLPYKPREGQHVYFLISDGNATKKLLKFLHRRCILNGLYWVEPNKIGRGMIKTPVDTAPANPFTPRMFAPVAITTEGGNTDGIVKISQDLEAITPKYVEAPLGMLDAEMAPDLTEAEIEKCRMIQQAALDDFNNLPANKTLIEKNKLALTQQASEHVRPKKAKAAVNIMIERSIVFGEFPLYFDSIDEPITARELAGPKGEEFDGQTLQDPLDPSPNERAKSMFFWNDGVNPFINCMKHGGYGLKVFADEPISTNDWLNRHHGQVFCDGALKIGIDKSIHGQIDPFDSRIEYLRPIDFKALYLGEFARDDKGNVITNDKGRPIPMADHWLSWADRNTYTGRVFRPVPGMLAADFEPFPLDQSIVNEYTGLAITPKKGDAKILTEYVMNVIANGNQELADYITRWVAMAVQRPDQPGQTVLVIKSIEGTGKGLFFSETIGKIFGNATFETASSEQVFGRFNGAASSVFIYLNEATWGGDKTAQGLMKQLATDNRISIERKYQEAKQVGNFAHVVITTNEHWAAAVGENNRRFVVFEIPQKQPPEYYRRYAEWLNNGGLEIALDFFLNEVDITNFDPRVIPCAGDADSALMLDQKLISATNEIKWMVDTLQTDKFRLPDSVIPSSLISTSPSEIIRDTGLSTNERGEVFLSWVPSADGTDATLTIPKSALFETQVGFMKLQKNGPSPTKNRLGRFLKGSLAGEGKEVFAIETQRHSQIFNSGRLWEISWQNCFQALSERLQTNRLDEIIDIKDVLPISTNESD